jgi:hypothetical protein
MPSTTWKTELTAVTDTNTIREIRQWLKRNGQIIPSRDADSVAKYLHLAVIANNKWGGVAIPVLIKRPRPVLLPWQEGYQDERSSHLGRPPQPDTRLKQLAQGAFGLLFLLALVLAFVG